MAECVGVPYRPGDNDFIDAMCDDLSIVPEGLYSDVVEDIFCWGCGPEY